MMEARAPKPAPPAGRRPRDPRLDFFRGLAMFIILIAHTPGNTWTLWIPARFGFSDAADIFVFCSGMASALAFGTVFVKRGWHLGTARILFRIWQVYWAHIAMFLVTAAMLFAIDHFGLGLEGKRYITSPYIVPFFERTGEALIGLMTLTYLPGLFDILPMYLVILAMVPLVMALFHSGGRRAVFAFVLVLWAAANLAGYARWAGEAETAGAAALLARLGAWFEWMLLPANPFGEGTWFFNPFGWQLVFFTGFAFGMKWLPAPPVDRRLILVAAAYVLLTVPFAWFKVHRGLYVPEDWALVALVKGFRENFEPLYWKSWIGVLRYLHFLALAYLAWVAVGPGGARLAQGFRPPRPAGRPILWTAAAVALATVPYSYIEEIKWLSPALDRWFLEHLPLPDPKRLGLLQIAHLAALVILVWAALGARAREWITRDLVRFGVPVIRRVGTQSLAIFMTSIPLARFNGWVLDVIGRDVWTRAAVNLWGFAVLIVVAYAVSWFKSQPWRGAAPAPLPSAESTMRPGGADGRGGARMAAQRA